ncbi:hypothetical protein [Enterococcus sp. LJL51]|uniref:hypothetical protein n=1 Tax=Enterococcus sp. LJL51 TaxID=3416656 RepID=UPI003CED696F
MKKRLIVGGILLGTALSFGITASAAEYPAVIKVYDKDNDVTTLDAYQKSTTKFKEKTFTDPEYAAFITMEALFSDGFNKGKDILPFSEAEFWKSVQEQFEDKQPKGLKGIVVDGETLSAKELSSATSTVLKEMLQQVVNYEVMSSEIAGDTAKVKLAFYPISLGSFSRQIFYLNYDVSGEGIVFLEDEAFMTTLSNYNYLKYVENNIAPLTKEPVTHELTLQKNESGNFAPSQEAMKELYAACLNDAYTYKDEEGAINSGERFFLKTQFDK